MDVVNVNWLAVLMAAIVNMVIGFAWYSDALFGKPWRKLMGMNSGPKPTQGQMTKIMILGFVSALIMAYVLTHNVTFSGSYLGASGVVLGLMTGFWLWLGYMLPVLLSSYLYEQKPLKFVAINSGYWLTSLLAMGVIIALWM